MRIAAAVFAASLSMAASANEFCMVPGRVGEVRADVDARWNVFKARKFAEVDAFHSDLVRQHESGRISDARLARYLHAFRQGEAWVEPLILEWVRLYPNSYAARYALAAHYNQAGWIARGNEFASKTSGEQFEAMRRQFAKAAKVLDEAERLTTKPSLSYVLRINMASALPQLGDRTRLYEHAIKAYPDTIQVRIEYTLQSVPKWGGSRARLLSIIDDAARLPQPDRRYVRYVVMQEIGTMHYEQNEFGKALEAYKESADQCVGVDLSLQYLMASQQKLGQWAAVVTSANELIRRSPRSTAAWESRGWAYQQQGKYAEAAADYRKAIELGAAQSNMFLGMMYEKGLGFPKDPQRAMDLYLTADRQGVKDARIAANALGRAAGIPVK